MSMTTAGVDLLAASRANSSLALAQVSSLKARSAAASRAAADGSTSGSDDGSDITSSDFLTLLVTEMQNQDPTQPTDPNAYIQHLVEVNSLQQLISINTDLGGASAVTSSSSSNPASIAATPASSIL
jgi:flagellar basal-body rod modification protein FlgD